MPWSVNRNVSTITVELSLPVDDWGTLLEEIEGRLQPAPKAIFLPATLANATPLDLDLLNKLWATLRAQGMPLRALA